MKHYKSTINFIALCLFCSFFFTTSCSEEDDNNWQEQNETLFDQIGKKDLYTPRNVTLYDRTPVKDTTLMVNIKKEEVVSHVSGIKYRILKRSNKTQSPYFTSKVDVFYEGRRIDGTVFDTNYGPNSTGPLNVIVRGKQLNDLIAGWTEVLQLMHEGDKFEVYIPWDLGYGNKDSGKIKAYTTLIFIIELDKITEL